MNIKLDTYDDYDYISEDLEHWIDLRDYILMERNFSNYLFGQYIRYRKERRAVVNFLRKQGLTDEHIAEILDTDVEHLEAPTTLPI